MPGSLSAVKAYRDKAERFRRMAADAISPEIRTHFLEIADDYTALAEAEEVLANMPNGQAWQKSELPPKEYGQPVQRWDNLKK